MRKANSFRHPVDGRSNDKIAALIGERGAAGYGAYWMIIEMLHREEDGRIEYSQKRIRRMQAQTGMDRDAFGRLLQDLIDIYELLAVEDACPPNTITCRPGSPGFLVSTIGYRRRKPKQQAIVQPPAETETPPVTPPEPAAEDSPTPQSHAPEDIGFHQQLKKYIAWRAPAIDRLLQPLTVEQSLYFREMYDDTDFFDALDQIQENPHLRPDGSNAYDVLIKVLEKEPCTPV